MFDGPGAAEGQTIEALRRQLAEACAERDEAHAGRIALAEVLQAINASPGDFTPVFEMIIGKAMTLGDAAFGALLSYADNHLALLAHHNGPPALVEYWTQSQRLDPAATELNTPLIVSDAVLQQIGDGTPPLQLKDRGEHELRGRSGAIRIWTGAP